MSDVTTTASSIAVSTLPKVEIDPTVQRVVERAVGRYLRAALGIEEQRLFGLHDEEMTPAHHRVLYDAALSVEMRAALREADA